MGGFIRIVRTTPGEAFPCSEFTEAAKEPGLDPERVASEPDASVWIVGEPTTLLTDFPGVNVFAIQVSGLDSSGEWDRRRPSSRPPSLPDLTRPGSGAIL
jgi:hypothetical protein